MSRMNGGEFFRFILGCWHSFTTLSISFHVFSMDLRSITMEDETAGDEELAVDDDAAEETPLATTPGTELTWLKAPCNLDRKPPRGRDDDDDDGVLDDDVDVGVESNRPDVLGVDKEAAGDDAAAAADPAAAAAEDAAITLY